MTSLDYHSPQIPRRWPWRAIGIAAVLLLTALALPAITVRQDEGRMDVVTGSTMKKTVWFYCITVRPHLDASPLEMRLKSRGISWTPSWQFLHNTHRNIFGSATCYECGRAPPIYRLLRPILKEFTASSTDTELREFVRIMQSGAEAEQRAAADAALSKGMEALSSAP